MLSWSIVHSKPLNTSELPLFNSTYSGFDNHGISLGVGIWSYPNYPDKISLVSNSKQDQNKNSYLGNYHYTLKLTANQVQ